MHSFPGRCKSRARNWLLFVCVSLVLCSCGQSDRKFSFEGRVLSKVPETHTLVVAHGDIPGYMPAMTMPYAVATDVDLNRVNTGDQIKGRLIVHQDGRIELDKITVSGSNNTDGGSQETRSLYPGEMIPDVELLNQDGKTIRLSDFRGKTTLLTFIYTRCPLPNFCPRLSSLFAAVERESAKDPKEYARTQLVSVSIDPKYDTPIILHKYGLAYVGGDEKVFAHWAFTVPTRENLKKLAGAFALTYDEQDDQISHTMSTVLIAPDGRMVKEWNASDWTSGEALAAMRQVENAHN
jgi:protein SCO1/2